jgi:integrase
MPAEKIPPGIYIVTWRNKKERGLQKRYRVKVTRKEYQADQLFDSLEEAVTFLNNLKSPAGRKAMTEEEALVEAKKKALKEWFENPNLTHFLDRYYYDYVYPPEAEHEKVFADPIKARSIQTLGYMKDSILNQEIEFVPVSFHQETIPIKAQILKKLRSDRKKFGDLRLVEIDEVNATNYIRERLKTHAAETVKREVSFLGSMYKRLRFIDKKTWEKIGKRNPFSDADLSLLKKAARKARPEESGRLAEGDEDRLFAVLSESKKRGFKEPSTMLQIVALSLLTGMRRGELLMLEWSRIKPDRIQLRAMDVKTGLPRWIPITPETRTVLDTIPRAEGQDRLFNYTPDGFAANWRRVKKKAGIPNFRFHDTRREFISRCLEQIASLSPVVIARQVGMASVAHVEKAYVEKHDNERVVREGIKSEKDLMKVVGHTQKSTTSKYFNLKG